MDDAIYVRKRGRFGRCRFFARARSINRGFPGQSRIERERERETNEDKRPSPDRP